VKRLALASGALLGALGWVRSASAETLDIEAVSKLAIQSGPELRAAREHAEAAHAQSRSAGGRLLPSVHVSDEWQRWTRPFQATFQLPGMPGMEAPPPAHFQVRDRYTNTFTVAGRQPLLGLLHGTHEYESAGINADAARAGVKVGEADTREMVRLEYLRLFQAKARSDIARASEQELAQEVTETQARVKAGTQTNADLLRIQVAAASARQDGIVAEADATVHRANLLSAIGRSPDDTTTQFQPPAALLAEVDVPVPAATDALARREEVKQARLRADAADHEQTARTFALLPEVDLEAAYSHVSGQAFAPIDSAFVGIKADWNIWEWGASYNAKEAASAEARAAAADVEATRRRVLTEVTSAKAELVAAANAVALANQTIASAQEAYRVTEAQVRAGTGTTTDLLNAESALTQARLQLENARYAQAAVRVQLERAMGGR
jgi:outer membrane protein